MTGTTSENEKWLYIGERHDNFVSVRTAGDGLPLNPRHDLYNHSPDGYEWGYGGSGPSQLALALCADYLGNDEEALRVYQSFKNIAIVPLNEGFWAFTGRQMDHFLAKCGVTA